MDDELEIISYVLNVVQSWDLLRRPEEYEKRES
jgi:hypothetical protein